MGHLTHEVSHLVVTLLCECLCYLVLLKHPNDTEPVEGVLAGEDVELFAEDGLAAEIALLGRVDQNVRLGFHFFRLLQLGDHLALLFDA